ncbi:MAG: glycosyltransferase family 39 protein [Kiritimatiellae bacterium]|nr:glycosyltransferase family 39 protein [Kiritimatiellia bacterium]
MAIQPLETRVQDVVYTLDTGTGLRSIQWLLAVAAVFVLVLLFQVSQFKGLKEPEAMELAQLGQNISEQRAFVTKVVRPASMEFLSARPGSDANTQVMNHPDMFHAPLYPVLLAAGFKLFPTAFAPGQRGVYSPEQWIIMPLNHTFAILTGVLVWIIAGRLFNRKVSMVATACYFLSRTIWEDSISGLGLTLVYFFITAAFYLTLVAADRARAGERWMRFALPMVGSAVLVGLAALTRYAALAVIPGLLLYLGFALKRRSTIWLPVYLAVVALMLAPWMARNMSVSGTPFGMAHYRMWTDSKGSEGDAWERDLDVPGKGLGEWVGLMRRNLIVRGGEYLRDGIPGLGDGIVIWPLFLTTFFFRFVRPEVRLFRWALLVSMISMWMAAALFGDPVFRMMTIFWPFIIIYGLAFFFVLLDRLQFQLRIVNGAITGLVVLLTAVPYALALLPPRPGVPYPPYYPPFIQYVTEMLSPADVMATDMPWATAWYGRRISVYLPIKLNDFYQINDYRRTIKGVYLTTLTTDLPMTRQLLTGPFRQWYPILNNRLPNDFPLTQGLPLSNRDQLFLTDQLRLPESRNP